MATYEFTGFTEADLLQGTNGSSIGVGDVFTMPATATTEFTVTDDDGALSGDAYRNEVGDDWSGQTADIYVNGEQVFDNAKIYAESYHVVRDQDGNRYYMIEIETRYDDAPGAGDDFFTFFGDVPPAGSVLSVISTCNVTCDWVNYDCLDAGPVISETAPENAPPVAEDDAYVTDEATSVSGNVLDNDSDPDGDEITVVSVEGGNVGESFQVTTAKGYTGQVTLNADGSFTFDPDENFKALAQDEQDSFTLDYTIADDPSASVKHNLLFVLDISNSTVGSGGGQNVFDGTGVGDLNGDGLADSVLDAEIAGVIAAVNKLIAEGVNPADIDIGLVTFSGVAAGFASVDAETLGTFALDSSGLMDTLMDIQSGGWTNYEAGLQQAEDWFASQDGDGAKNKLMFLSDGRPIVGHDGRNYITQTNADYGDEVSRIAGNYNADIYAIGVGANSDLDYLNDLDNTGGAERVLDTTQLNAVLENAVATPGQATATITVTINGLNQGPDAVNDAITIAEDESATLNVLGNDSDPDGDQITITQAGGVAVGQPIPVTTNDGRSGTVTVAQDGTLSFTPGAEFTDMVDGDVDNFQITYTITDGQFTDTATVTVTVNGKGQIIDAVNDAFSVAEQEDIAANILDNDVPMDGSLSVTAVSLEQGANPDVAFAVGESFVVTTQGGRQGTVTVAADGSFEFDGGSNFVELGQGETDQFVLNYTAALEGESTTTTRTISFDGLCAGDVVSDQIEGLTMSAQRNGDGAGSPNDAMIFDSANPTGGDYDLATPSNGNILIISEDNDSSDPDDNAGGGAIDINFDDPTEVQQLTFIDTEEGGATITLTLADGSTQSMTGPQTLNGGIGTFTIGVAGVVAMNISLIGSGAIDDLVLGETTTVAGAEDDATITVVINGQNDIEANDDELVTQEGVAKSMNILDNDVDVDEDTLTVTAIEGGQIGQSFTVITDAQNSGTVTVESDGTFTFDPGEGFDSLMDGQSDSFTLTYTAFDGLDTDTAQVLVIVNGEGTPVTTRTVDFFGNIEAEGKGTQAIAVVIDVASDAQDAFSGAPSGDPNFDGVNSAIDTHLQNLINLAATLDDDQEIAVIPVGMEAASVATILLTAGQINAAAASESAFVPSTDPETGAANPSPLQELFSGVQGAQSDIAVNLKAGYDAAKAYIDSVGADSNEVLVLASSDGYNLDTYDFQSDPTESFNNLNAVADVDVVLIKIDMYTDEAYLGDIDSDGLIDVIDNAPFGLDSIIDAAPTIGFDKILEIKINDQTFEVTDDADASIDGFQWSVQGFEIEPGSSPTVMIGVDLDGNQTLTDDEYFDISSLLEESGDSFTFDVGAVDDLLGTVADLTGTVGSVVDTLDDLLI